MFDTPKQAGLCTLCDAECFTIKERWPEGHLLAGQVRKVGKPIFGARRDTFLLSNGSRVDLTFCENCKAQPGDLEKLWARCVLTGRDADTPEHRAAVGASTLSKAEQVVYDAANDDLAAQSLTGPIESELWVRIT